MMGFVSFSIVNILDTTIKEWQNRGFCQGNKVIDKTPKLTKPTRPTLAQQDKGYSRNGMRKCYIKCI